MSSMKTRKSNGPRWLPCGTPDVTLTKRDMTPLSFTFCERFDELEANQSVSDLSKPNKFNLSVRSLCSTLSNDCYISGFPSSSFLLTEGLRTHSLSLVLP